MRKFFVGSLVALMCSWGGIANAVQLSPNSYITFGGVLLGSTDLATTAILDFIPPAFVTSVNGDLASTIASGNTVTFNDFTFAPFTETSNPVWTVGGFQFDLSVVNIDIQNPNGLVLLGQGFVKGNGFDPTAFDWSLSADKVRSVVAFSATNVAAETPEPASLLLVGTGLISLSYCVRKKRI